MSTNNKTGLHAMQYKTIDGLQIRFATNDKKSGDPILLLSPLPESILAFLSTWDMFAALGPIIAVDLPPFGRSETRADTRTPEVVGDFVLRIMDALWNETATRDSTGHRNSCMSLRCRKSPRSLQKSRDWKRSDRSYRHSRRLRPNCERSIPRTIQRFDGRTICSRGCCRYEALQATGLCTAGLHRLVCWTEVLGRDGLRPRLSARSSPPRHPASLRLQSLRQLTRRSVRPFRSCLQCGRPASRITEEQAQCHRLRTLCLGRCCRRVRKIGVRLYPGRLRQTLAIHFTRDSSSIKQSVAVLNNFNLGRHSRPAHQSKDIAHQEDASMKTAKELLQAYINGSAMESAALFADKGALELPYLADLGVEPRYEGPKNIGAFLTFLHEKMYPNFKFVDVKIYIDTPDQAFGEYTIHPKVGDLRQKCAPALLRSLRCRRWQDRSAAGGSQCTRRSRWYVSQRNRRCDQQKITKHIPRLPTKHPFGKEGLYVERLHALPLYSNCHD